VWSEKRLVFVGTWVKRTFKDSKANLFLAHFYTVTTVTKTDTDTFSRFLVLHAS